MDGEAYVCVTRSGVRLCERCASSQEQGLEACVPAPPGCASVALACHAAPHHRSKGRKCASLHRLGARASRSRVALRLITGARVGSMRPCTAWVRERRARVSRCASSQEQGLEACVPALPGCASVALACRAAPHHINKRDAACCVPFMISPAAGCGERITYCRRNWCTRLRSPCATHRWPRGMPSTHRRSP